ncbi:MAG: hypothetical protein MRY79_04915 [Alphaproteobacteria bacterium]|nr:hypothetical protein [Alphaproteobacteria bacterium]
MNLTGLKVQILEKIGAPLAAAIDCVVSASDGDEEVKSAEDMAKMLSQAVEMSIHLSQALDIKGEEEEADSIRVALAALVAPLLGEFYRQNNQVPDEAGIKRLNESFEAVLAFAENFKSAQDQKSRLVTLTGEAPLFDDTQTTLVTLQALTPVMNAIAEFPFGQPEKKLLQDVAGKLEDYADDMAEKALLDKEDKLSRLLIFKALAQIYAACHRAETARLTQQNNGEDAGAPSPDVVWEAFALRLAMVEAVIVPGAGEEQEVAPAPVLDVSAETDAQSGEPQQQEAPAAAPPPADGGGPMGFFKPGAKPADTPAETGEAPEPPTEPPATPPPSAPPPAAEETDAPPASPPSGNPMGFFKPGAKPASEGDEDGDDNGEGTVV